ncbi:MAG: type IV toxin-antitoxin system AbiEi family antitoxin domain-containing protein [Lentisphaeraceae bacterium]|nr:type IV toxin-antitoxin system AbiEi family antitoxin domain-containing protein [Lentisphaeraceae bacterium]
MTQEQAIKFLNTNYGIHRTKEIISAGIPKKMIYQLRDKGVISQISRGIYQFSESSNGQYMMYIELNKRIPRGVFCLISSLHFHNIGTQIPYDQWIALPHGVKEPRVHEHCIQYIHPIKEIYELGIEEHVIEDCIIKVYSVTKTVIDCFKHRSKVGLDVALEALKEAIRLKKTTRKELIACAIKCRTKNTIMPYLESI